MCPAWVARALTARALGALKMNRLQIVGQIGIVLEFLGAGYLVCSALSSKKEMHGLKSTIDSIDDAMSRLIGVVKDQFQKELIGFILLAIGLVMQFLSGFARSP